MSATRDRGSSSRVPSVEPSSTTTSCRESTGSSARERVVDRALDRRELVVDRHQDRQRRRHRRTLSAASERHLAVCRHVAAGDVRVRSRGARAGHRRTPDRRRHRLLRHRRDRPQPPGRASRRRRSSSCCAKQCGVDAVKLQKRDNRRLFTRALYDSPYDNENSFGPTYGAHREALELDRGAYVELQASRASSGSSSSRPPSTRRAPTCSTSSTCRRTRSRPATSATRRSCGTSRRSASR